MSYYREKVNLGVIMREILFTGWVLEKWETKPRLVYCCDRVERHLAKHNLQFLNSVRFLYPVLIRYRIGSEGNCIKIIRKLHMLSK